MQNFYQGRKVLVTGASGYIASALVPYLDSLGASITLSARSAEEKVLGGFKLVKSPRFVSLLKESDLEKAAAECDVLFHLAGQTSVRVAEENPLADLEANLALSLRLLKFFSGGAGRGPRGFVAAGTATVVGLPKKVPLADGAAAGPITVYDLHKSMVERYLEFFAREKGLPGVALRLANVYGPGKASGAADRGILQKTAKAALAGQKITVFGSGEYIRDYVFLDDVVQAFAAAGRSASALAGKSCFVCTGEGRSVLTAFTEVARQAERLTGKKVEVALDPAGALLPIDQRNFVGDASFLRDLAGWRPATSFAEGVALTLKAFA